MVNSESMVLFVSIGPDCGPVLFGVLSAKSSWSLWASDTHCDRLIAQQTDADRLARQLPLAHVLSGRLYFATDSIAAHGLD